MQNYWEWRKTERDNKAEGSDSTTSGRPRPPSTHPATGQLLLSPAPAQTRGLIKPLPRHGPINHLMMGYHGDRWAASMYTKEESARRGSNEHVRAGDPIVHVRDRSVPKYTLGKGYNMESAVLILGAARLCLEAKHLVSSNQEHKPLALKPTRALNCSKWRAGSASFDALGC